jgi:hypothetical protein
MTMAKGWEEWNFLAAEKSIADALKASAMKPGAGWARFVGTRLEADEIEEEAQSCPGIYVIYGNFTISDADQKKASLVHSFFVTLSVSSAEQRNSGYLRTKQAGELIPRILQLLHGFVPDGCTTGLIPATPPKPTHNKKFSYYPLRFTAEAHYRVSSGPGLGLGNERFPNRR